MRALLLIPGIIEPDVEPDVPGDSDIRPRADYSVLREALGADILDYGALTADRSPGVARLSRRVGRDAALASLGYSRRREYDIIFTNAENVAIPLALLLKRHRIRPLLVTIGHRLSAAKKRLLLRISHSEMDAIFVYAAAQQRFALNVLGVPARRVHLIPFHADHRFFRDLPSDLAALDDVNPKLIASAGLEWRDYATLVEAVRGLDVELKIAAASPWSRSRNETSEMALPANVTARAYNYSELRRLYADSRAVVVPLYPTDFQAGITTILEGMAMAKPVIATRTVGQADTIVQGRTGMYVPPSDSRALREAIETTLQAPDEARKMGLAARAAVESGFTLDHWVERIAHVMHTLCGGASSA